MQTIKDEDKNKLGNFIILMSNVKENDNNNKINKKVKKKLLLKVSNNKILSGNNNSGIELDSQIEKIIKKNETDKEINRDNNKDDNSIYFNFSDISEKNEDSKYQIMIDQLQK